MMVLVLVMVLMVVVQVELDRSMGYSHLMKQLEDSDTVVQNLSKKVTMWPHAHPGYSHLSITLHPHSALVPSPSFSGPLPAAAVC